MIHFSKGQTRYTRAQCAGSLFKVFELPARGKKCEAQREFARLSSGCRRAVKERRALLEETNRTRMGIGTEGTSDEGRPGPVASPCLRDGVFESSSIMFLAQPNTEASASLCGMHG